GNISITANALVSGASTGVGAQNGGTGTTVVTGGGAINGGIISAIIVSATGNGPGANINSITISGTGDTSNIRNPVIFAQITNAANNSNIVIDRSGTISGRDGIHATTAGGGNIAVTTSNNIVTLLGDGIAAQVVNGTNNINVTAGTIRANTGILAI